VDAGQNLVGQFNMVKEALLDALVTEKLIKQEHADLIKETYAVVLVKRGWLGTMLDKFFWKTEKDPEYKIVVVRIVK